MKKILFAAMAALAITSCSQNEEIEAPAKKAEIKFNTAVSKTSRAADITNDAFTEFKAYAYNHTAAWASAASINSFFSNIDYSKNSGTWVGKNASSEEQTFYWPETDYVSFFAYYDPSNTATWKEPTAKGAPTLEYTVQTTVANQKDLVVAELIDKQKSQTNGVATGTVSLVFKHALTKIGFKIKGEGSGVTYTVNSITINAQGGGTYTYKASNASNAWAITSSAATDYIITLVDADKTITGGAAQATDFTKNANYVAMLIPQALTDVTIKIDYIAKQGNAVLRDRSGNKAETIALSGTTATWTSGKYIVYTLGLKAGEKVNVEGTYTAESWEDGTQEINTQQ